MDAENQGVFFGHREEDVEIESGLGLAEPLFSPSALYGETPKTLQQWALDPECDVKDSELDDVLPAINPNDVYPSAPHRECFSESDSSTSEDPCSDSPPAASECQQVPSTLYQVVYDISSLGNVKVEPELHSKDVISIQLGDEWSSHVLISESCIVNELPLAPAGRPDNTASTSLVSKNHQCTDILPVFPDLHLTEEEQKLLTQEGISLPNNLPLTKAEERILKKVRRKIRNKQSAQDSRRRKKEYIDGLESRVAACSMQNEHLQRTVEQLERHNMSLLAQLRKLQALIKPTATKAAQTGTCIMIIIFSLTLIILPSYSPFRSESVSVEEEYEPTGVISRNILTDPASILQTSDDLDEVIIQTDVLSQSMDTGQSDLTDWTSSLLQPPVKNPERDSPQMENQSRNSSKLTEGQTGSQPLALSSAKRQGLAEADPTKPAHADEM